MSVNLQLLLVAVLAAGVLVAWIRSRGGQATAPRPRLSQLAWLVTLAALGLSVARSS